MCDDTAWPFERALEAGEQICVCIRPAGHTHDLHVCECGGGWRNDRTQVFEPEHAKAYQGLTVEEYVVKALKDKGMTLHD